MQPAANLRVAVDVDAKKGTQQLALFDANLKATAASAKDFATDVDTSTKTVEKSSARIEKANSHLSVMEQRFLRAAKGMHVFHGSVKAVKLPGIIAGLGLVTEAATAAAGGVVALTGALGPVTGLAASAGQSMFALGTIMGTVAVAGIGDAAKAAGGLNEKLDEEAEAFKSLSPAAQDFARTLDGLKEPFRGLQEAVQGPLFGSLTRGIEDMQKNLPTLQTVLTGTATALGRVIERFAGFVGSKGFASDFAKIGEANNKIIGRFGNVLVNLTKAFMDVTVAARPLTQWLANVFERWSKGIAAAAQAGRASGGLAEFFRETRAVVTDLGHLFMDLGAALYNIMKLGAPLGREIIDRLREGSEELRAWTESAGGRNKIKEFFESIRPPLFAFGRLIGDVVKSWFHLAEASSGTLTPIINKVRTDLLPLFTHLVETTQAAFGPRLVELLIALTTHFGHLAGTSGPLNLWVDAMTNVIEALNWMIDHVPGFQQVLVTLIGLNAIAKTLTFASAISGMSKLVSFIPGLLAFSAGFRSLAAATGIMNALTVATGLTTVAVRGLMLATGIGALITAVVLLETKFHFLEPTLNAVKDAAVAAFGWIKAAAADLWGFLQPIFHRIGQIAKGAWEVMKTAAKIAWDAIMLYTLPARKAIEVFFKVIKFVGKVAWEGLKLYAKLFWGYLMTITWPVRKAIEFFFNHIKEIGKATWDVIKFAAKVFWEWLKIVTWPVRTVVVGFFNLIKDVGSSIWNKIKGPAKDVFDWLGGAAEDVAEFVVGAFNDIKLGVKTIGDGIANTFTNAFDAILGGLTTVLDGVASFADAMSKLPGPLGDAWDDVQTGIENAADSMNLFREGLRSPEELAEQFDLPRRKAEKLATFMDENPGLGAEEALRRMNMVSREAAQNFADRMGLTQKAAKILKDYMDKHPGLGAKEALAKMDEAGRKTKRNFPKSLKDAMDEANKAVDKGGGDIVHSIEKQLTHFGIKGPDAREIMVSRPGGPMGPGHHTQRGGYLDFGAPSGDSIPLLAERGEYMLNREATAKIGRQALDRINFKAAPRFQGGGMVDPAGPGTGVVNPAIAATVGRWSKTYDAAINYGYDPGGGHVSPGHNVTGTATDTSPAAGWTGPATAKFEQGLKSILGSVDQILYGTAGIGTPYDNHGRGNHAHIEWGMHPAVVAALAANFKLPRFIGKFVQGKMGAAGLNKQARAMEKIMGRRVGAMGGGADVTAQSAGGMFSKSELVNLWRSTGRSGDPNLMAAIGLAESGGDPNVTNSIGARGLWQIIPSTAAAFNLNYARLTDPALNAQGAHAILEGQGLGAWEAYTNGAYQQYMQRGGLVMPTLDAGGRVSKRGLAEVHPGDVHRGKPKIELHFHGNAAGALATLDDVYAIVDGERVEVEGFKSKKARMRRGR